MRHSPLALLANLKNQISHDRHTTTVATPSLRAMYPGAWVSGLLLLITFVAFGAGCEQGNAPARGKVAKQFDAARDLVHSGNFDMAIKRFDAFLNQHGTHHLAVRASFLRAKCELGRGDLEQAEVWFQRTIKNFPATEEASKAEYKLAVIDLLREDLLAAHLKMKKIAAQANGPYTPEASAWVRSLDAQLQAAP